MSYTDQPERRDPVDLLEDVRHRLNSAITRYEVVAQLRATARLLAGADGITIVRRDGDDVVYLTEDAIGPLWAGQRFPIERCVTGMAIIARAPIVIADIAADRRVPMALYRDTFVRSMAVFPVCTGDQPLAIGVYWAQVGAPEAPIVAAMYDLSQMAADALRRIDAEAYAPIAVAPLNRPTMVVNAATSTGGAHR